jgi:hypothetical protein
MTIEIPEIVYRALTESITSIGQLSKADKILLDSYAKKGYLAKGKGGPFPALKTVYAYPGYDFLKWRQTYIGEMQRLEPRNQ